MPTPNPSNEPSQDNQLKVYNTPSLTEYGTIQELTLGGGGSDFDAPTGAPSFAN
jgi:hypothetical protein